MAWVHLLGRKFSGVLTDENFELLADWPYHNRYGVQGHSYYGYWKGRRFCISQSRCEGPDTMGNIARVFRNGDCIDTGVGPFYSNSKRQIGLLVAAWDGSQWLQMISPGTPDQPNDYFVDLAEKIRQDRTIDPHPLSFDGIGRSTDRRLQELCDILEGVRVRRDFDW